MEHKTAGPPAVPHHSSAPPPFEFLSLLKETKLGENQLHPDWSILLRTDALVVLFGL